MSARDPVIGKSLLNAIVATAGEQDNFVPNILPALSCRHDIIALFFKGIQDFEWSGGALVFLLLGRGW
jgi:hypothetical protein